MVNLLKFRTSQISSLSRHTLGLLALGGDEIGLGPNDHGII